MAFGVVYVLVGLLGFLVTGFSGFVMPNTDKLLLGFEVNPLHNIAHLSLGLLGIAMARTLAAARAYGWLLAVSHVGLALLGLFVANKTTPLNFLSLNVADNILHVLVILTLCPGPGDPRAALRPGMRPLPGR